ncbi:hypothetical protein MSI_15710 [Treponema sp. JC4]|uniref:EAL domain-containing protein n=1 Tax=Treponema sp. JC4 TaxID=1124982 RepID=UPI00025B0C4E|nr:EAL domain-containing protein [Treponema sp. JC4]EID84975.1 hypothetical protein MSI_15710 [Treponema sp. JC4]
MWNYNFVLPNISLLITFLIFYLLQPHMPISKNRAFLRVVYSEILILLLDIISSRALENYNSFPVIFHLSVNIFFFVVFCLRGAFFFYFTYALITPKSQRKIRCLMLSFSVLAFCIAVILLNFFVPTLFILDESGYHRWKFYNLIYFCSFFYVGVSFLYLLIHKQKLSNTSFYAIFSYNLILFIGYYTRLLFPRILIMDFFCLLAIIVIFFAFENSSVYIESRTQAFRVEALNLLLEEQVGKQPFMLGIQIHNYNDMREIYTGPSIDQGLGLISEFLHKAYPDLYRFYLNSGRFILFGNTDKYNSSTMKEEIRTRFKKAWKCDSSEMELYLDVNFVEFQNNFKIKSGEMIFEGILTAFNNMTGYADSDTLLSQQTLDSIKSSTDCKRIVRLAVEERKVEMFLQPIISTKTQKVVGAEALARIRNPDGSILPPGVFIAIAEKNGHINLLGEQMFEKACQFASTYDLEKYGIQWINVNLSPLQFLKSDLEVRFKAILQKYNVKPGMIHLEITEEAMIDYALLKRQVHDMKKAGFEFVLDDFGSGYSNVTRLNSYPFINIKLDMQVVWEYFKTSQEILPALVQAFKESGFSVTAEGIEDKNMALGMKKLGCDYLQGFYYSKPISQEEFVLKYLTEH